MSISNESSIAEQAQAAVLAEHWSHLRSVASAYRLLLLLFLLRVLGYGITQAAHLSSGMQWPISLGFALLLASAAYRLAAQLRAGPALLWAVSMFLPLMNLLALLLLSRKATRFFQDRGIRVGFLGPSSSALAKAEAEAAQAPLPRAVVH